MARDQTSKFNSDLNKIRQQQAGVTSYLRITSHDERVRALHSDPPLHCPDRERKLFNLETLLKDQLSQASEVFVRSWQMS